MAEGGITKACTIYGALTLVATIYGCFALVAKAALSRGADPIVFAFYRCFGGTMLLLVVLQFMPGLRAADKTKSLTSVIRDLSSRDICRFAFLGLLLAGNICGFITASSFLPALTCSIFQPTMPIFAMIFSLILGVENVTIHKFAGVTCSIFGAICVVVLGRTPTPKEFMSNLTGMLCLLGGVMSTAAYFVCLKDVVRSHKPVFATAMAYMSASAIVFFAAITKCGFHKETWLLGSEHKVWMGVAYAVLLTTAFNYSVTAWANQRTTPMTVTAFTTLQPMAATICSWILLGVGLTRSQMLGGICIVFGLLLIVRGQVLEAAAVEKQPLMS